MKSVSPLVLLLCLTACSSKSPSTSEVKAAIEADFKFCPYVTIKDVEIVNGLEVDERTHRVHVTYVADSAPLPAAKFDELKAQDDAHTQYVAEWSETDAAFQKRSAEHARRQEEISSEIGIRQKQSGLEWDTPEYTALRKQLDTELGYGAPDPESEELSHKLVALQNSRVPDAPKPYQVWGEPLCWGKIGVGPGLWQNNVTRESVASEGNETGVESEFTMVKSDNGWIAGH